MRNGILTFILWACLYFSAQAQLADNRFLIGGGASLSSINETASINLSPTFGFVTAEDRAIGGGIQFNTVFNNGATVNQWRIGVGLQRFKAISEEWPLYMHFQPAIFAGELLNNFTIGGEAFVGFTFKPHDRWLFSLNAVAVRAEFGDLNSLGVSASGGGFGLTYLIK